MCLYVIYVIELDLDWIQYCISGNYDACSSNRDLFQSFLFSIDNFELSPNGSGKNRDIFFNKFSYKIQ